MKTSQVVLFLVIVSLFIMGCSPQAPQIPKEEMKSGEGRAVFAITDAAADMNKVTSVKVTIDEVQVHSATEGWMSVSSDTKTVDLLELKAQQSLELLADVMLKEGVYQQVRLDISKVVVTDDKGEHEAKLPSGELKIVGELVVNENMTSTATFDFIADESLHQTGNGQYILAPVVKIETKERANVEITSDNKVKVSGGVIRTDAKVGMDVQGNIGVGLGISKKANLSISDGKIKIGLGLGIGKNNEDEQDNSSIKAGVKVGVKY